MTLNEQRKLSLDPRYTYFHPLSLALVISSYSPSFPLHSHYLFILLLFSVCFPLCFPAAGNRTYRLWPDGDDGQAVPAQDHHCWHQRLCPPHWLRPHQEGGQELSLCSLLSILLSVLFWSLHQPLFVFFDFSSWVMNVRNVGNPSSLSCLNGTYSYFLVIYHKSLSNDGLKKELWLSSYTNLIYKVLHTHTQQLFLPLLPTHPHWTWICPLTHACTASTYNHLSDSRRATFLLC